MKFFLNEDLNDNRLILCEDFRLILNEDDDASTKPSDSINTFSDQLAEIQNNLTDLKNNLTKISNFSIRNVKIDRNILQQLKNNQTWNNKDEQLKVVTTYLNNENKILQNLAEIIDKGQKVQSDFLIDTAKNDLTKVKQDYDEIQKLVDEISNTTQGTGLTKLAELKNEFENFKALVEPINANMEKVDKILETNLSNETLKKAIEEFEKNHEAFTTLLGKFNESKLDIVVENQEDLDSLIKDAIDMKLKIGPSDKTELDNLISQIYSYKDLATLANIPVETIKNKLTEQTNSINELNNSLLDFIKKFNLWLEELESLKNSKDNINKGIDWAEKYNKAVKGGNANTINKFWADYFKATFKVTKARDLFTTLTAIRSTLEKEIRELGWTTEDNPFIYYLSKMLEEPKFISSLKKDPLIYNAIHNAFVERELNIRDLRGDGILGKNNIIFNTKLFNNSILDIRKYLHDQAMIERLYNDSNNKPFRTFKNEKKDNESDKSITPVANSEDSLLNTKYGNKITEFITDLFYKNGNVLVNSLVRTEGNPEGDLYSTDYIDRVMKTCFTEENLEKAASTLGVKNKPTVKEITNSNIQAVNKEIIKLLPNDTKIYERFLVALIKEADEVLSQDDRNTYYSEYTTNSDLKNLGNSEKSELLSKYNAGYNLSDLSKDLYKKLIENIGNSLKVLRDKTSAKNSKS